MFKPLGRIDIKNSTFGERHSFFESYLKINEQKMLLENH